MPEQVDFSVFPARNKVEALEKFGAISTAMAVAHATLLRLALNGKDEQRGGLLRDARANLEAQMQLAQIELYIHNLPD